MSSDPSKARRQTDRQPFKLGELCDFVGVCHSVVWIRAGPSSVAAAMLALRLPACIQEDAA